MNALVPQPQSSVAVDDLRPDPLAASRDSLDLRWLLAVFRRRLMLFIAIFVLVLAGMGAYLATATRVYTASANVMLDTREMQVVPANSEAIAGISDSTIIDTQVEAVRSRQVAERVAAALRLDKDPEFNSTLRKPGPIDVAKAALKSLWPRATVTGAVDRSHQAVVDAVLSRVEVRRVGTTYVMQIACTSLDPEKAARIANNFANAYLQDQLDAQIDTTRQANSFLSSRLGALQKQAQADATAVAQYKIEHNLLSATGASLTEQEVSTYNQGLASASADAAADEARLRTARDQLANGSKGDDVGEAIGSTVVGTLRAQRAQISGQLAQMTSRYGPKYPEVIKAEGQLQDIDAQIQGEINRIISNLQAKANVSHQRLESMQASLARTKGVLAVNNAALARLTELQQTAAASQALYDSYLSRFKETGAEDGVGQSRARIISKAEPPTAPSAPKTTLLLALGVVLAFGSGLGAIIIRQGLDPALVTSDDVERRLHLAYMGAVPLVVGSRSSRLSPMDMVVRRPRSAFAEAIRGLRASLNHVSQPGRPTVVTVTSALPGDGKTVTALCLGRSAALAGTRTVVVDCDLRGTSIARFLLQKPKVDLNAVLDGAALDEALVWDAETGAAILPALRLDSEKMDRLNSAAMDSLLEALRQRFELIILDSAPVLPVVDARILAAKSDVTLLVARWGKTPDHSIRSAIKVLASAGAEVTGIALTQMDMRRQAQSGFGDSAHYFNIYKGYFAE